MKPKPRAADLNWITPPLLDRGVHNALTDVPGVLVGHTTLVKGAPGPLEIGRGPVRTGVTAVRPHPGNLYRDKVTAAVHVLNGYGKTTGLDQVRELGALESPILLTNTLSVWRCADYLLDWTLLSNPHIGISPTGTFNPVVGECNDGWLNDIQGRHITREHVFAALDSASSGPVTEGCVGAGTGTTCYRFKGGIGTASRILPAENGGFTVGLLLQSNFGAREQFTLRGQRVGQLLGDVPQPSPSEDGSCMIVIATDAPLSARQLARLARRAPLGLARTGFTSNPGSGDFVVAFSSTCRKLGAGAIVQPVERLLDEEKTLGLLFQGVVETAEEAVLNSLLAAETTAGRDGHIAPAVPAARVQQLLAG